MSQELEREKRLAAEAASELVQSGMTVGLGSGSTAAYLIPPLAERALDITCVATSRVTAAAAVAAGLNVVEFTGPDAPARLDIAIDGADQVDPRGWLVKGGGGAHTREKAVAAAADLFVVIVSANKIVERLTAPVPLELALFGLAGTLRRLAGARLRDAPPSPDGGLIADYFVQFDDPAALAATLSAEIGIVEHGLFPAAMVGEVLIGAGDRVQRMKR